MYTYKKKRRTGPVSILFIVLFLLSAAILAYLWYTDKGIFWDHLPIASMVIVFFSLVFAIFNFIRRNAAGFIFILFFIVFVAGVVISGLFGPFASNLRAENYYKDGLYAEAIGEYLKITEEYPTSKYYENAIKNLPFAYYEVDDLDQAFLYLKKAEEKELITADLKVKDIYIESYLRLAERHTAQSQYRLAAGYYMEAMDLYRQIQKEYPGSDQAFIAETKIPELAFLAGTSFWKVPDWDRSIDLFTEVIDKKPGLDLAEKASEMLFVSHVNKALEHKNDLKYSEAAVEFLNIMETFTSQKDSYRVSHYREVILSDIPRYHLDNIAYDFFRETEYGKAAYLYRAIIDFNPENAEEYIPLLSKSKIEYAKTIRFRDLAFDGDPSAIYIPETSILEIENSSTNSATLYLVGPQEGMVFIFGESTSATELAPGTYQAVLELDKEESAPFFGNLILEERNRYRIHID